MFEIFIQPAYIRERFHQYQFSTIEDTMGDASITFTFSGRSSILEAWYFPPIELAQDREYVLGLIELLTFNSIPNIDLNSNKFYVGNEIVEFPVGSYEISDIKKILAEKLNLKGVTIILGANNSILGTQIKYTLSIDFVREDSIENSYLFTSCPDSQSECFTHWLDHRKSAF